MKTVTVKLNDADLRKLRELKGDIAASTFLRDLIKKEYGRAEESIETTSKFLDTIRKADLSKLAEMAETVEHVKVKVDEMKPLVWEEKEGKEEGLRAIDYLNVIHKMGQETFKKVKDLSIKESGPDNSGKEIIEKLRQQDVNFAHYISQILTEIQNLKR